MYLAEQITGLIIDPKAKQLSNCRDDRGVRSALDAFASASTDSERFSAVFGLASNPLRLLLSRLGIKTYTDFASCDADALISERGVGRMRCTELSILQKLFRSQEWEGASDSVSPFRELEQRTFPFAQSEAGYQPMLSIVSPQADKTPPRPHDAIPPKYISTLSTRLKRVLEREHIALTPSAILSVDMDAFREFKAVGRLVLSEMQKLRADCTSGDVWNYDAVPVVVKPNDFESLASYIRYFLEEKFKLNSTQDAILRDYMALQDSEEKKTLAQLGEALGLTRERIRQIAQKMEDYLVNLAESKVFDPFVKPLASWFDDQGGIVTRNELSNAADSLFSWKGTKAVPVVGLLRISGLDVTATDDGLCIVGFETRLRPRYKAFIEYINNYKGRVSGLDFPNMAKVAGNSGFAGLTYAEYSAFVRKGMTKRIAVEKNQGHRKARFEIDIQSLPAKQFFASKFGIKYGIRKAGTTPMRKEAILEILEAAGYQGETAEDVFLKAQELAPQFNWSRDSVRGILSGGWTLDDDGTSVLPYDRGRNSGERTRFSLTSFFMDEKTRSAIENAGREVRDYMAKTGLGIVSVWKIWRKYRGETALPLPKLGFYMMMRFLNAGGLEYPSYPRISYPGVDACEKAYQWELYQYFRICGRERATFFECISFFVDCLGLQPSIAGAVAFPATGMRKDINDDSVGMLLKMPEKADRFPNVLLGSVKPDPQLNLLAKPERHPIASCYLSEDGRAVNMTTYARLFMRDLESANYGFTNDDIACLTDPAWCRHNLNISTRLLWPVNNGVLAPRHRVWLEPFNFGTRQFQVQSDWEIRSKAKFDVWAARIAALAGIDFTPYELASQLESE